MSSTFLNRYPRANNRHDEMLHPNGEVRPHWEDLINTVGNASESAMRQRVESVQRQIKENGVTYNIYADTQGAQRPWDLDVLPLVIPEDEWAGIEAAVIQRAELLNAILVDVYGAQSLFKEGQLPLSLLHANAGFLRPCHGIALPGNIALHHYAVDIARAPNGQWWVIADRTQAPSGAGYALENRTIISNIYPELFYDLKVRRLSEYFSSLRDSLNHWGRLCAAKQSASNPQIKPLRDGENPLAVILTPGPYNETYHEQSYLAGYLGFPLVQGSDLTVRNNIVMLKTLSGLKPVHAIMRRVDDDFCDPLELNSDSLLGVSGLIKSARAGNVLITNSLGSNILESGSLLGFLPKLCQHFFNAPLKMPSVASWWCGEASALEYVIANLNHLVIKPAFPQRRERPIFGEDLSDSDKDKLIQKLRANPNHYLAQELVKISQAPVWDQAESNKLTANAIGLRVYVCATPNGYVVMPGGLTRVAAGEDNRVITIQQGGTSKDTWVLGDQTHIHQSLIRKTVSSKDLVHENAYLSSRTVENLYWFGRYSVRINLASRLLRASLLYFLEYSSSEYQATEWTAVHGLCVWYGLMADTAKDKESSAPLSIDHNEIEKQLISAVLSKDGNSLAKNIQQFYQLCFNLRERLSLDNWRAINQFCQIYIAPNPQASSIAPNTQASLSEVLSILNETCTSLVTLSGYSLDGMTRDHGWRFLSMGRRIERIQFLCTLIQSGLNMPVESNLDWLLELTDSIVTYRSRYSAHPELLPVLDLILLDENNPNAMIFQLKGFIKYLTNINDHYGNTHEEQIMTARLDALLALNPDQDFQRGSTQLMEWLQVTYQASIEISESMSHKFFSYSSIQQESNRY